MPISTILRPPAPAAAARQALIEKRAAAAMWETAHELELEWRNDRESARNFAAVALAGRMAHDMDRGKLQSNIPLIVMDPEALRDVIARFSVVVRQLPVVPPAPCTACEETGFVARIPDQGEICPVCGGARVIGSEC